MKFVADRPLIEGTEQAEFTSKAECAGHSSPGRRAVQLSFCGRNFHQRKLRVRHQRRHHGLGNDRHANARIHPTVAVRERPCCGGKGPPLQKRYRMPRLGQALRTTAAREHRNWSPSTTADIVPTEHDEAIAALLEEFVRPAVEADGGAIDFRAFVKATCTFASRRMCRVSLFHSHPERRHRTLAHLQT